VVVQPLLAEPQQPQVALGVEGAVGAEPELPVGLHLPVQVLQRLVHLAEGVVQVLDGELQAAGGRPGLGGFEVFDDDVEQCDVGLEVEFGDVVGEMLELIFVIYELDHRPQGAAQRVGDGGDAGAEQLLAQHLAGGQHHVTYLWWGTFSRRRTGPFSFFG